ncbi:MAG: hypothetical protein ACD_70C00096G0001 [uncultured bacterium]|nr:MAG: hypothetical protein ACD_70C00096G0001 [uncultured bacterium]
MDSEGDRFLLIRAQTHRHSRQQLIDHPTPALFLNNLRVPHASHQNSRWSSQFFRNADALALSQSTVVIRCKCAR